MDDFGDFLHAGFTNPSQRIIASVSLACCPSLMRFVLIHHRRQKPPLMHLGSVITLAEVFVERRFHGHSNRLLFSSFYEQEVSKMTVTPKISIDDDGNLVVQGKTILTGVPDNVVLTPGPGVGLVAGAFIGATASDSKSIHVFPMGTLE